MVVEERPSSAAVPNYLSNAIDRVRAAQGIRQRESNVRQCYAVSEKRHRRAAELDSADNDALIVDGLRIHERGIRGRQGSDRVGWQSERKWRMKSQHYRNRVNKMYQLGALASAAAKYEDIRQVCPFSSKMHADVEFALLFGYADRSTVVSCKFFRQRTQTV